MVSTDLLTVRLFLKAKTADELVKLQLQNNIKHGITFQYDIMHDGKLFYAWYLGQVEIEMRAKDASA